VVVPETVTGKVSPDAEIVLQPNPVPDVQISAFDAPEHDGSARADGVVAVSAPRTVLAACDATLVSARPVPDQFPLLMVTPEGNAPLAMPVAAGSPVAFVRVTEVGVPRIGVTNVGDVEAEIAPEPFRALASAAPTPVPRPVMPPTGTAAAVIDVLQLNPELVVQIRALAAVEQEPIASAVGAAEPEVALPVIVFVACAASPVNGNPVAFASPRLAGVPVALVRTRLVGVPPAPLNKTGAPGKPTLTPSAVAIPVPNPLTPVLTGRPVAFVRTPCVGVPSEPE
jgi:hypothetical protein